MVHPSVSQTAKTRLLEEKIRLEQDLNDIANQDKKDASGAFEAAYPEIGGNSDDDNAIEITAYADEISIVDRLQAELRDVNKALKSIEDGTYGTCKYCGKIIDEKRLEARPTSSSCVACKKQLTQEL